MSREYTYTLNEFIEFIERYFPVNHYKRRGNNLITSEFSIVNTDIDLVVKYFDKDMRVFDINMTTFAGGWENKRSSMIIEMDVCEEENKYTYWIQTPDKPYIDRYQLKSEGQLDEITKEQIFNKIIYFFNRTCNKEQLRDIKLIDLGI